MPRATPRRRAQPPPHTAHVVFVKHRQAADVKLVGHALRGGERIEVGKLARVDGADQVLAQAQRVEAEVDFDGHVDNVQGRQLLVLVPCATAAEAAAAL